MPEVSLPVASLLSSIGNAVVVIGALLVLTGTLLGIWTGSIKEGYATATLSANEASASVSKEEAESAKDRAAAAEKEASDARAERDRLLGEKLELQARLDQEIAAARVVFQKDVSPRKLTEQSQKAIHTSAATSPPITIVVRYIPGDNEAENFARSIASAFDGTPVKALCDPVIGEIKPRPVGWLVYDKDDGPLIKLLRRADLNVSLAGSKVPHAGSKVGFLVGSKPIVPPLGGASPQ